MESKVSNSDKSGPEKSNVIKGAFGATRETSDALKRASKTPSLGTVKDELKRAVDKPSEELRTNDGRFKLLKHFFRDLGLMPDTDVHQKSKTLSNSVTLQNEIAGVRKELARELTRIETAQRTLHSRRRKRRSLGRRRRTLCRTSFETPLVSQAKKIAVRQLMSL